jgi:hypothetical protein
MTTALERGKWSAARPGRTLLPGKTRYPLHRRLGGPQGRSGQVRKSSPPPRFASRTVQLVASRYTDWATRPTICPRTVPNIIRAFKRRRLVQEVCAECLGEASGGCTNIVGLSAGKRQGLNGTHSCASESCLSRHLTKHKHVHDK